MKIFKDELCIVDFEIKKAVKSKIDGERKCTKWYLFHQETGKKI